MCVVFDMYIVFSLCVLCFRYMCVVFSAKCVHCVVFLVCVLFSAKCVVFSLCVVFLVRVVFSAKCVVFSICVLCFALFGIHRSNLLRHKRNCMVIKQGFFFPN